MGWKSSLFCLFVQAFERAIVMNGWDLSLGYRLTASIPCYEYICLEGLKIIAWHWASCKRFFAPVKIENQLLAVIIIARLGSPA